MNAATSSSNPGSAWTSGASWVTSANIRLIVWVSSVRICSSPGTPTIREAVTRRRVTASVFDPFLTPNGLSVSAGLANGSNPSFVQSSSIALNVSRISGVS